jgi:hypothetical protein
MSEFASYAVGEAMDAENDRWLYRQGIMSDADAFDLGVIDHCGQYCHVPMFSALYKTCKHCGSHGLTWMQTKTGWRLGRGGAVHVCEQYKR